MSTISREDAIEAICTQGTKEERDKRYVISIATAKQRAVDILESLPTIDPVKRGRWVKQTDENCWWYECSECGDYPMKNAYGHEELSAYCPHCGAKMEGEEG